MEKMHTRHAATMEIAYGTIRRISILRRILADLTDRPPRAVTRACFFCGLYELLFMRSEHYAVLNETVELTKQKATFQEARFINALLRKTLERKEEVLEEIEHLPPATRFSHPETMWQRWEQCYGREKVEQLCRYNNEIPYVVLRPLPMYISPADYMRQLEREHIQAQPHPANPDYLVLPHGTHVRKLPGYHDGIFTIQDPAAALAVELLAPQPGEIVLDACAAPGGKTILIEHIMQQQGKIIALDCHEDRLAILRQNLHRTRARIIQPFKADARTIKHDAPPIAGLAHEDGFDAILLDVPCSNTGVLRRRPDARWRFSRNRLAELARTQRMILQASARCLRPGGRLVYSTCSLEAEENIDLVKKWVLGAPGYKLVESRTLFPPETQTDGAFAALITRQTPKAKS